MPNIRNDGRRTPAITEKRLARRRWDHEAGFAAWCDGVTLQEIADQYGVTIRAVTQASRRERWAERRHEIDEAARKAVAKRAVKTIEQRVAENLKLIDAAKVTFARGLQSGSTTVSASELASLMKMEQVLIGGPSERIAGETAGHRRSLEQIEAELAELPDGQVDALVAADAAVSQRLLTVGDAERSGDDEPESEPAPLADPVTAGSVDAADLVEVETVEVDEPEGRGFWKDQDPHGRLGDWSPISLDDRWRGPAERARS